MAGGEGKENSFDAMILLPEPSAAAASRPVFVSDSSHDAVLSQKVCSALEAAGFPCWIASCNVIPGTIYADGIVHAIDESSILVLILSEQAVASAHVGREIERAASKRPPVVALRIDAAPLTPAFEYFLNQSQWIEGGGSDAAVAKLVSAVGQHLAPGTALPANAHQATAVQRIAGKPVQALAIAAVVVAVLLAGSYLVAGMTDHPFAIAEVYAFRAEPDEALKWLERAYAQKDPGLVLVHNPAFKTLEDEARYKRFLPNTQWPG